MNSKCEEMFAVLFSDGTFLNPPGQPWHSVRPTRTDFPYAGYCKMNDELLPLVRRLSEDPDAKYVRVVFPDGYEEALRRERAKEPPTFEVKEVTI